MKKLQRAAPIRKKRPRVYLAAPVSLYSKPGYDKALQTLAAIRPDVEIQGARGMYLDASDWLNNKWPKTCASVDELVFVTDSGGVVGRGVYIEVCDVARRKRPVWLLLGDKLIPVEDVVFEGIDGGRNWSRFAVVKIEPRAQTEAQSDALPARAKRRSTARRTA